MKQFTVYMNCYSYFVVLLTHAAERMASTFHITHIMVYAFLVVCVCVHNSSHVL